jgi:sec-independent protein translocase protein TatB
MGMPPTIEVANLGMADSLILMVMALVVFGPRRLPQIGRQMGKLMYEFRKASNDFKFQMEEELRNAEEADRRKKEEAERQRALALGPAAQPETASADSQVSEAVPETPGATTATADAGTTETPYTYPTEYAEGTTPEAQPAEAAPAIQPPATGEPVPAEQPAIPAETAVAPVAAEAAAKEEAAVPETSAVTEPVAHNG